MKNLTRLSVLVFVFLVSCTEDQQPEEISFDRRSFAEGEKIYKMSCMQCHQQNGEGLNELYPPLANSDFLLVDKQRAACIIWNGIDREITVNGKQYHMKMLPVSGMSITKVTDVLNYIYNAWGHKEGIVTPDEVRTFLKNCK